MFCGQFIKLAMVVCKAKEKNIHGNKKSYQMKSNDDFNDHKCFEYFKEHLNVILPSSLPSNQNITKHKHHYFSHLFTHLCCHFFVLQLFNFLLPTHC